MMTSLRRALAALALLLVVQAPLEASTIKALYGTPQTLTITTSGLASDGTLLIGRQSSQVDNETSILALDALLGGSIPTSGSPTANTVIEVWVWASWDGGTTRTAGMGTTDAGKTLASNGVKHLMALGAAITQSDTTARTYDFGPVSVAQLFGGSMPDRWGVWLVHNTGAALGTATIGYRPLQMQNVQ